MNKIPDSREKFQSHTAAAATIITTTVFLAKERRCQFYVKPRLNSSQMEMMMMMMRKIEMELSLCTQQSTLEHLYQSSDSDGWHSCAITHHDSLRRDGNKKKTKKSKNKTENFERNVYKGKELRCFPLRLLSFKFWLKLRH